MGGETAFIIAIEAQMQGNHSNQLMECFKQNVQSHQNYKHQSDLKSLKRK